MNPENHQTILNDISDGVYRINRDGYFTYLNPISLMLTSLPPDNYQSFHYLDVVAPEERERVQANFERVMRGEENPPYEAQLKGLDGRIRYIEVKSRPIFSDGQVVEMLGIARDITARRQAEEALRLSEEKNRMVLDNVTDGIYRVNTQGYFTYMNSVLLNRYGLQPGTIHTRHFLDMVTPEHRELVLTRFEQLMQGKENPPYELNVQTGDGGKLSLEIKSRPIFENGKVVGVLGVSRDITARRQAEETLRRSEENYRLLLGNISDGVYQLDTRGYFSFMNKVSLERTGLTAENFRSVHYLDIVIPEEHERTQENFQRVMQGEEVPPYEVSYIDQEGRKHYAEIRTRPITENGNVVGLVGISRDITARKKSEDLLLNAKTLLEHMVEKRTKELEEKAVQLTESEKRYRAIFENTGAATCIIEKDTTVSFLNGEFERITGYSKEEFKGKIKLTSLIHKEDLPRLKEYHRLRRIEPAAAPRHYDFRMVDREGRVRDLFATIDLIPGTVKSVASVLDITDRKQMERSLMEREKELQVHSRNLEEMNTALKVLLRKLETEKQSVEAEILANAKENIIPYLDEMEKTDLSEAQKLCIDAVRKNLNSIVSPFVKKMKAKYPSLSIKEAQVARLIGHGRTTKEIAVLLKITPKAVEFHRFNIRKKLRISGKKLNLQDFLANLSDRH